MSVTAVTQQKVEQLQVFNFADYSKFVPGLTIVESSPGNTQLILRGLNSGGDAATVATYIDDTPYGSSNSLANGLITTPDLDTFDMQRIEVDRGPQGTLYGASSLGGVLKFVTNPPDPSRFAAMAEAGGDEVENSWGWSAKGMVNLPLGQIAALRIVGTDVDDPGYIDDPFRHAKNINEAREQGLRASLLVTPTSNLTVRLTAIAQDYDADDLNSEEIKINPATGVPLQPLTPIYGDLKDETLIAEPNDTQNRIYNGTINWNLGWSNLVSSTSYGTYASQADSDATLVGVTIPAALTIDKFTEEDRLQSPGNQQLEWLAGFYYTRETSLLAQKEVVFGGPVVVRLNLPSTYEEEAGFATLTYHFTPQFDVAVGGRYAHNDQRDSESENGATLIAGSSSDSTFTYSVEPRWRPNADWTVYGRIASGYQPGGPNAAPSTGVPPGFPLTFGPDTVVSYEAGVKADVLEHTLSFDIDAYHLDWNNIQLLIEVDNTGVDSNGGRASSDGFEGEATWTPIPGLTFSANAAYTDARLTQNTNPVTVGAKSGSRLPYSPDWAGTLDGAYTWPINDEIKAFVGATWAYVGDRESQFSPAIGQVELPSYNTWDLRAGLNFRANWTVEVFAKNVGDARGISSLNGSLSALGGGSIPLFLQGITGSSVTVIQPRTVGFTLTARY
jgi:iron complex outermembrane receptor protein